MQNLNSPLDVGLFWVVQQQQQANKQQEQAAGKQQRGRQGVEASLGEQPQAHLPTSAALLTQAPQEQRQSHQNNHQQAAVAAHGQAAVSVPTSQRVLAAAAAWDGRGDAADAIRAVVPQADATTLKAACSEALLSVLSSWAAQQQILGARGADAAPGLLVQLGIAPQLVPGIVARLLDAGADPSLCCQSDGLTPLLAALRVGSDEVVQMLLERGASPDPPPEETPAAAALPQPSSNGAASKRKREQQGGAGLPKAAAAAARAGLQPSPLVLAVSCGHLGWVERLVAAGADPNRPCTMAVANSGSVAVGQEVSVAAGAVGQAPRPVRVTPLIAAIGTGCLPIIDRLLAAGANLHLNALSVAVLAGRQEVVAQLVEAGACGPSGTARKAGATSTAAAAAVHIGQGHPALRATALAAKLGRVDAVRLLYPKVVAALQGGHTAAVGALRRNEHRHPLAAAAEAGHLAVVELLLELGAPVDHSGSVRAGCLQVTPLMLAAEAGQAEVVQRLLAAGASAVRANCRDEMAASLALRDGHLGVVALLLEGSASEEERTQQLQNMARRWQLGFFASYTPRAKLLSLQAVEEERQRYQVLLRALLAGNKEEVQQMVDAGAVAHAAAGSARLLDRLLESGVSSTHTDADGSFLVQQAAHLGWPAMCRLLRRGADVNQAGSGGATLLHYMAGRPALAEAAQALMQHAGVDLQARDSEGRDPLGAALQHRNRKFGEALLQALQARQSQQRGQQALSPAEAAAWATKAYELLGPRLKCLADVNLPGTAGEHLLVKTRTRKQLHPSLLLPGINVNARDASGATVLMLAAHRQQPALVAEVLSAGGVELDATHLATGSTALHQATSCGDWATARALLAAGADPSVGDSQGDTPLMALARQGQHRVLSALVQQHSAPLEQRDAQGRTALHHAALAGRFNACKVLRALGADVGAVCSDRRTASGLAEAAGHPDVVALLRPPRASPAGGAGAGV